MEISESNKALIQLTQRTAKSEEEQIRNESERVRKQLEGSEEMDEIMNEIVNENFWDLFV